MLHIYIYIYDISRLRVKVLNAHQTVGCNISLKVNFFTFQLSLVRSEPGSSKRRTKGKFPPRFFHHEEKICGKLVTTAVENLLQGVYCQLQKNELHVVGLVVYSVVVILCVLLY